MGQMQVFMAWSSIVEFMRYLQMTIFTRMAIGMQIWINIWMYNTQLKGNSSESYLVEQVATLLIVKSSRHLICACSYHWTICMWISAYMHLFPWLDKLAMVLQCEYAQLRRYIGLQFSFMTDESLTLCDRNSKVCVYVCDSC